MHTLEDRIALVTGANKGIGFEIARQLGKHGIHIFVGARDPDRGQTAVALLTNDGIAARHVPTDLLDAATIQAAAADIEAQEQRLDILVNNAGITDLADASQQCQLGSCGAHVAHEFPGNSDSDANAASFALQVVCGPNRERFIRSGINRTQP